jgi:hypothetical protein
LIGLASKLYWSNILTIIGQASMRVSKSISWDSGSANER